MVEGGAEKLVLVKWGEGRGAERRGGSLRRRLSGTAGWYGNRPSCHSGIVSIRDTASQGRIVGATHIPTSFAVAGACVQC